MQTIVLKTGNSKLTESSETASFWTPPPLPAEYPLFYAAGGGGGGGGGGIGCFLELHIS